MLQKSKLNLPLLGAALLLSGLIYLWIDFTVPNGILQTIKIERYYALVTFTLLYIALLENPFTDLFSKAKFVKNYRRLSPTIVVSTFYFALLHFAFSFFGELGGFAGILFLSNGYLIAIGIALSALTMLFLVVISLFDFAQKLKFFRSSVFKILLYIVGLLVLIHALMLGADYSNLKSLISQTTFVAFVFLLILIAFKIDKYLINKFSFPKFGVVVGGVLIVAAGVYILAMSPFASSTVTFDIHAAHKQLAEQALQTSQNGNINTANIPGLNGDRTKRYTVSFSTDPKSPEPNEPVSIRFKVYDASTGLPVNLFQTIYTKKMHFILTNNDFSYFSHVHPDFADGEFSITTTFPNPDIYHLYVQFQPFGAIEQQVGFTLKVGDTSTELSRNKPDDKKTKTFGNYKVSVDTHGGLEAKDMSAGLQTITFTLKDAKTGEPITNLKPYLSSFGHLSMINQKTFDFIHVHPYNLNPPAPDELGGPTVDFLPIGIYGPFKPGVYHAFAEFNPDGKLFTADFTIEVK